MNQIFYQQQLTYRLMFIRKSKAIFRPINFSTAGLNTSNLPLTMLYYLVFNSFFVHYYSSYSHLFIFLSFDFIHSTKGYLLQHNIRTSSLLNYYLVLYSYYLCLFLFCDGFRLCLYCVQLLRVLLDFFFFTNVLICWTNLLIHLSFFCCILCMHVSWDFFWENFHLL